MFAASKYAVATLEARASDLLDRIQRIEAEQAALRAQLEGEWQLRFLTAEIVEAAQAAPVIGRAIEHFACAMRAPLPRGCAGGLARASTAWRYLDGRFMPQSEKREAYLKEYERFAAGGRVSCFERDATRGRNVRAKELRPLKMGWFSEFLNVLGGTGCACV
jgi:hypothetical protein